MMKEVVRALETGVLPQIGLVAFLIAFALVVVYAFTMSRAHCDTLRQIPLDDDQDLLRSIH